MTNKAKIYTYTVINSASADFVDKVPYVVAILEDAAGTRFPSYVEGYKEGMDVSIGMDVEFLKEDKLENKIYKFI
ncbi:OB-fold domain-containing protein [Clostridium sp. JN-1]|uniref:Zn-ribbon domain-containing OB-fold protein n=1 Tax=Clostridium sp. JN-1 TaxID=2483110 RepID=UPI000F0BC141|nr:OB-fold domain-containing protein [Clostridium sp. JN-1]